MKLRGRISKNVQQTFMGGVAGSLVYFVEQAASELVPNYPAFLNGRYAPLPRNGSLIATVGPLAAGWAAPKILKRKTAGTANLKMGLTLYDGPKLLHDVVCNLARTMGTPAGLGFRVATPSNGLSRGNIARAVNRNVQRTVPRPTAGLGRFTVSSPASNPVARSQGLGRYAVR